MFSRPVAVEVGERVERDGFVFADVVPREVVSSQVAVSRLALEGP